MINPILVGSMLSPQGFEAHHVAESRLSRTIRRLLIACAVVLCITVRCRLLEFPLERDEGEYAYAGQLLLQGIPPYQLAYNMKLPGTYLAYAGIMAVFGQTVSGVHLGLLALNLATIGLVYLLGNDLFDRTTAAGASLIYAILSLGTSVLGISAHATHFLAAFGLAASLLLWRQIASPVWWRAISSGTLFGIAFLMKQQGLSLIAFGGCSLVVQIFRGASSDRGRHFRDLVLFSAGVLTPYIITCGWLWAVGSWDAFQFWTLSYAMHYGQSLGWHAGSLRAIACTLEVIGPNGLIWFAAAIGAVGLIDRQLSLATTQTFGVGARTTNLDKDRPAQIWFFVGYTLCSMLCITPGLIFRNHYYIVVLPAVAISASAAIFSPQLWMEESWLRRRARQWWHSGHAALTDVPGGSFALPDSPHQAAPQEAAATKPEKHLRLPLALVLLGLVAGTSIVSQRDDFFFTSPTDLCRRIYGVNPFPESTIIADYLRQHTTSTDTIAVLGSEPQLYFLSHRHSATGYIYTYALLENQPFARRMQHEMIEQIEANQPAFLVDVRVHLSWGIPQNHEFGIFEWKKQYIDDHYHIVGFVDIWRDQPAEYHWDEDTEHHAPRSEQFVAIYQRR